MLSRTDLAGVIDSPRQPGLPPAELHLPVEIWHHVMKYVDQVTDLKNISLSSRLFNTLARNKMWRVIQLNNSNGIMVIKNLPVEELIINAECNDEHMQAVGEMSGLKKLDMNSVHSTSHVRHLVTDTGMSYLSNLLHLNVLNINGLENIQPEYLHVLTRLPLQELYLGYCDINDSHMEVVGQMLHLKKLDIMHNNEVTGTGLAHLANVTQLEMLNIAENRQAAAGLSYLTHLPLQDLYMSHCNINDSHMEIVGQMSRLNKLDISSNKEVTGAGLSHLANITHLQILNISHNKQAAAGLSHLTHLPLQLLYLVVCDVNDSHMEAVGQMSRLRKLDISSNHEVTGTGMSHLANLTHLEMVIMMDNSPSPTGLSHFTRLPLQELYMSVCNLTDSHMEIVGQMLRLKKLNISFNHEVTGTGLSHLANLTHLEMLNMTYTNQAAAGLSYLTGLTLQELHVSECSLGDSHMAVIGRMLHLRKLAIFWNLDVKDDSFLHLSKLVNLEEININGCRNITSAGLSHIKHLPIQELYADSAVMNDPDIAALAQFPHLKKLILSENNAITDLGLSYLASLKKLHWLDISGTDNISTAGLGCLGNNIKIIKHSGNPRPF